MIMHSSIRSLLRVAPCALLLAACSGEDAVGSSATYTTSASASTTTETATTTTTGESESATEGTVSESDTEATTTTTTGTTTAAEPLVVDCGAPPPGAVGAEYSHMPTVEGGVPGYSWSAEGLPEGLEINGFTGAITGEPAVSGDFTVELTVEDSEGMTAMATCAGLAVADGLSVDLSGLEGPCITGAGSLLDYVQGGDGGAITCSVPGGTGNGKLPAGITVNPETCAIEGSISETRYGTWAWIVEASQSGVEIHVPYCATQDEQAPGAYTITGMHSGGAGDALTPATADFAPGELLKFDGDGEPRFEITTECGNACFYGYVYAVSSSLFGGGPCKEDSDGCYGLCPLVDDPNEEDGDKQGNCSLLPAMGFPKEGFVHEMWSKGDVPSASFENRPWIVQWSIDYCISTDDSACKTKSDILENGSGSNLEFAVIMRPKG